MALQISLLPLGTITIDKNKMVSYTNQADVNDPHKANEIYLIPVHAFLIRTEGHNILFDTGCNAECMGPNGRWEQDYQAKVFHERTEEQTIVNQLKRFNLTPDDITEVVLSHMHNDHAGGVELFKNAQIYVHHDDFTDCVEAYALNDRSGDYIWEDTNVWTKIPLHWNLVEREDPDFELVPGVKVINLGSGHTRGDMALLVQLKNRGNVILTGDAIYSPRNVYPTITMPGVVLDTLGWKKSLKKLLKLKDEYNAEFWYGHEYDFDVELAKQESYD